MPLALQLDAFDLVTFTRIASEFGTGRFGYVVTPNIDHIIRYHDDPAFRATYSDAAYVLLDSRLLSHLLRATRQLSIPVCTGSDLTAEIFGRVVNHSDEIVLIGGSAAQADSIREKYGLERLHHFNPPMGFIRDPAAVEDCVRFIENHSPFRFCFLAVGSPQQELLAQAVRARGVAKGLALCTGAAINFLTGHEQRAPRCMQRVGLEWAFRLAQSPRRMAYRYLVRGPRILGLLRRLRIAVRGGPHPTTA